MDIYIYILSKYYDKIFDTIRSCSKSLILNVIVGYIHTLNITHGFYLVSSEKFWNNFF